MKSYILPLSDPKADLETVGGKGMSLAKLANAGLPVPGGFHVTTEAYRQFVDANHLQNGINAALTDVDTAQPLSLELASETIGNLFAQAEIPQPIAEKIQRAYEEERVLDRLLQSLAGDYVPLALVVNELGELLHLV